MIEAKALSRAYGEFQAVRSVSFDIGPGEIVGLLGHNGAGKTTIMKMLTGYLEPSAGSAWVDGLEVEADREAAQAAIGYLPESLPVYPEMLVADYLAYVATLRSVDPRTAVPKAIASTELGEKALAPIQTLSRGFKQRVGVAQAILHEPRCVILDEPTNGLDPDQTQQMRDLIRSLAERSTVILSTHIMQEVDALCDRALILSRGELVLDKTLAELRQSAALKLRTRPVDDLVERLRAVPGVATVTPEGDSYRLDCGTELDAVASAVATALADAQLPLYELFPIRRDLETVFREANERAN
ncbi:MAG: ATP-binding cassette domain-containing protein [Pseudomonadota bacterium]